MSLRSALDAVTAKTISSVAGMTVDNCKSVDESVFAYIQSTDGAPDYCAIIEYGGFGANTGAREFRSTTLSWNITVNYYHMIRSDEDYTVPYEQCVSFVDTIISSVSSDPKLGGSVMAASIRSGGNPIPYRRGSFWYIMVDVVIGVTDNIT